MDNYACKVYSSNLLVWTDRNNKGVCKDLVDRNSCKADLVTVLPPRSCLLYKLPIQDSIKNPNGCMLPCLYTENTERYLIRATVAVTLRSRDDCPILGLELMPKINIKPGSFAINSDSSFSSEDQILIGIGKLCNTETDLVVPIAVVSYDSYE